MLPTHFITKQAFQRMLVHYDEIWLHTPRAAGLSSVLHRRPLRHPYFGHGIW